MAFKPKNKFKVNDKVVLTRDFDFPHGTFEKGTEMFITSVGVRGYNLTDGFGNNLNETFDVETPFNKSKEYYEQEATEEEFLKWYEINQKEYERPSVTVDNIILAYDKAEEKVKMLMIKRKAHPFKDCWALAGGFVGKNENTDQAVIREVKEETNIDITLDNIEQLYTFSNPNRDPRTWVITVSYLTFLPEMPEVTALDDAKDYMWFTLDNVQDTLFILTGTDGTVFKINTETKQLLEDFNTNLSFDHNEIIWEAFTRINGSLNWKPNVLRVLGDDFTLNDARKVYSQFLPVDSEEDIDNSNFKKTHANKLFVDLGTRPTGVGRPSRFYKIK